MEIDRLEQELRDHFKAEVQQVQPSLEWWRAIITNLGEQKRQSLWSGLIPKTRLAWVILPLIILLVGGTAYGATFVVKQLFLNYSGHVEEAGLVQELDLSQTIDDITVSLERAYADSNVVLVGFTVSGPEERYFTRGGELSTVDGQSLPKLFGMGVVPGSDIIMGGWRPSERTAVMAAFDASLVEGEPTVLNLRLETQISDSALPGDSQSFINFFKFDFNVPFNIGKSIEVGQTAEVADIPITLERVEITPWATRVVFQFYPPYDKDNQGTPIVSLELPNGSNKMESFGRIPNGSSLEYQDYFIGDFTHQHGEWTITISELVFPPDLSEITEVEGYEGKVLIGKGNDDNRLAGPWIFHFEVP